MHNKRFKLIYFSTGGSEVREFSLDLRKVIVLSSAFVVCFAALLIGIIALFTNYFHNSNIASLKKSNTQLRQMLAEMEKKVKKIETNVEVIKSSDQQLRQILDMTDYTEDERKLGRGGLASSEYTLASIQPSTVDANVVNAARIAKFLDDLDRRLEFVQKSREEIEKKEKENQSLWNHIPSINPVQGEYRFTDSFGWRVHPLTRIRQYHEGQDISAKRGTPVVAAADGRVTTVVGKHDPNRSYGRYIAIDHGEGYLTLYAHLKTVEVKEGQEVRRGQVIGTVGDTGSATGPHLHYEVHYMGSVQDPLNYILEADQ
ncbi:MAG: M23 family metallopeptidase [candidate division KSB1 bacterium]|nr:M23 family metallopeptidase [candidate division KSB1 bacterium]MDZ7345460.1 M23 family metallopeptidase [candidate division KSB1 bacterium]